MEHSQLTNEEFDRFREFIWHLCGICIAENKLTLLTNRLKRRLRATGIKTYQTYFEFLQSREGASELSGFLDAITTNETSFFRTEKHFEWLSKDFVNEMLGRIRKREHEETVRVWSAACSTGEEVYTIAICLDEARRKNPIWQFEILGTDISQEVLERAKNAVYNLATIKELSEDLRKRYFESAGSDAFHIKSSIRDRVKFQSHNLLSPPPATRFDIVFLRNVLIYFNRESKQKVIEQIVKAIRPGGYLVIGPSEGIFDMLPMLKRLQTFVFQKETLPN
jgi:chemotaxis protein methyltransferase CheR